MFFVFGREEKGVEKIQAESRTPGVSFFFFWSGGCLGPFIAPTRFMRWWPFKGCHLQDVLDWVDLDTPGKILTSHL